MRNYIISDYLMRGARFLLILGMSCGARTPLLVVDREDGSIDGDASKDGSSFDAKTDTIVQDLCPDAGLEDGPCTGIACSIPDCGVGRHTTVTATVYDPTGARPVYDVFTYVPNTALEPIPSGPICATCQAAASGHPIVTGVTDVRGKVTLTDPPAGSQIPIVLQIGKWRRQVTVPVVACQNNVFDNPNLFRLPRNQSEGDIPKIAYAAGCDDAQCFLAKTIGIDASEFTGPSGNGRVHVYSSEHADMAVIVSNPGDAYALWGDLQAMKQYDILFNACECTPFPRTTDPNKPAYENMKKYLEAGGRMFGTHYHYNWFSPPDGPADFQKQAPWLDAPGNPAPIPFYVDTSHPRGKAFADWLVLSGVSTTTGELSLIDTRADVGGLNNGQPGNGAFENSTQWLYHPMDLSLYLSFNTPTNRLPGDQCGRAVFSDVHLSGSANPMGSFPSYCGTDHRANETALEFLFFDLSSCVQDDTKTPVQPCQK